MPIPARSLCTPSQFFSFSRAEFGANFSSFGRKTPKSNVANAVSTSFLRVHKPCFRHLEGVSNAPIKGTQARYYRSALTAKMETMEITSEIGLENPGKSIADGRGKSPGS